MCTSDKYVETEKGAIAFKTSGNEIVDYFMRFVRGLDNTGNHEHLQKCWDVSPEKTIAIIFNGRDRKNGKKEKTVSNEAMRWLRKHKPNTYKNNIRTYVDKYGRWKDLLYLSFNDCIEDISYELEMFATQLQLDKTLLEKCKESCDISLCAKWAPTEGDRNDKKKMFAKRIASIMFGEDNKNKMAIYRKEVISPLRKHLNIVEKKMCDNQWTNIDYKVVPAVASKRLSSAFKKHDPDGYEKYLELVRSGKVQMKVTGILPHELAKQYIDGDEKNETTELQWKTLVDNVKECGILKSSCAIVDVSGSMFSASNGSIPAQVAIALGIMTSCCSDSHFGGKIITFSENPQLVEIPTDSLYGAYQKIKDIEYGMSTDFIKCCNCIIDNAIANNICDIDMPKKIFVFTDMQFDRASNCETNLNTVYQIISSLFKKHNYTVPQFIYWNLNSDHGETFPVDCSVENTAMVSGFSEQLLKIFMKYDKFDPEIIVEEILKPYLEFVSINDDEK